MTENTTTTNYARHIGEYRVDLDAKGNRRRTEIAEPTGQILFFGDDNVPAMIEPQRWAFYRLPAGADPDKFRGSIIGQDTKNVTDHTSA